MIWKMERGKRATIDTSQFFISFPIRDWANGRRMVNKPVDMSAAKWNAPVLLFVCVVVTKLGAVYCSFWKSGGHNRTLIDVDVDGENARRPIRDGCAIGKRNKRTIELAGKQTVVDSCHSFISLSHVAEMARLVLLSPSGQARDGRLKTRGSPWGPCFCTVSNSTFQLHLICFVVSFFFSLIISKGRRLGTSEVVDFLSSTPNKVSRKLPSMHE